MPQQECPTRETLQSYLAGNLDDVQSQAMDHHLEECIVCEETATNLERDPDTFVDNLRKHPISESAKVVAKTELEDAEPKPIEVGSIVELAGVQKVGVYEIKSRLGRGGMGNVYLAQHRQLGKQVALKLLPPLGARNADALARFQREMRAVGKLDHSAIVRATDAGESDGHHFLVMERITGLDLSQLARHVGPLPSADVAEIARQAALGLSYAHAQGVVHRDIKPSNLMLSNDGNIKILDFGLAQISLWEEGTAEITTVGQLMGTLDYMAPEQAERHGAVDYRADLYSLGATLFRLLTGRAPLAASPHLTPLDKLRLLAEHSPPDIATLRNDVPEDLRALIHDLLQRDPNRRPPSAAHVAQRLAPIAKDANLQSLLTRANAKEYQADDSNQSLLTTKPSQPNGATPSTQSRGGRIGRIAVWIAASLLPISLIAGIGLIVETQKGQLVIQSDNANVKIKLLADGNEAKTLQITPGTQSTRLKAGKYDIAIESPSDSFTLDTDTFTIMNGQTVVASVKEKSVANSYASTIQTNPVLSEYSYGGMNLEAWLSKLQYEGNQNDRVNASVAIQALILPQNRAHISDRVVQILKIAPREEAFRLLPYVAEDQFFVILAGLLERADQDTQVKLLEWTVGQNSVIPRASFDRIDPLLQWLDANLAGKPENDPIVRSSIKFLSRSLFERDQSPQTIDILVKEIDRLPQITFENFWFSDIQQKENWSSALNQRVLDKVRAVIADVDSNGKAYAIAISAANDFAMKDPASVAAVIKSLTPAIKARLSKSVANIDSVATDIVNGEWDPSIKFTKYQINPVLTLFYVLENTGTGELFRPELTTFHAALPIHKLTQLLKDGLDDQRFFTQEEFDRAVASQKSHLPTTHLHYLSYLYNLSGKLLGIPDNELFKKLSPPFQPANVIRVRDVLAVHISGLATLEDARKNSQTIILQAGSRPPVQGLPYTVNEEGEIGLPHIGVINVLGKTPQEVKEVVLRDWSQLSKNYTDVAVSFLSYAGENVEVRQVTGANADLTSNDTRAVPANTDTAALNEAVYEGKSLDGWLRILEFESNDELRIKAANAIVKMTNDRTREMILQRVIPLVKNDPNDSNLVVFRNACRNTLFAALVPILDEVNDEFRLRILKGVYLGSSNSGDTDAFLKWIDDKLAGRPESDPFVQVVIDGIVDGLSARDTTESEKTKLTLLTHAEKWPQFTNQNFWLRDDVWRQVIKNSNYRNSLLHRISTILSAENSDAVLLARVISMASTITMNDEVLASSFVESNKDSIKRYLQNLADNPMRSYEYLVREYGRNANRRYVPIISLLELIELSSKADLFKEELATVHKNISIESLKKEFANIGEESRFTTREHLKSRAIKDQLNEIRRAYITSGVLIGKTVEQLENEIYPVLLDPNLIRARDVLAVHILRLTPVATADVPPQTIILQAGMYPPVRGLPFTVSKDGNIQLPLLGDFHVAGKTPTEARNAIWAAYKKAEILEDTPETQPEVAFLMYGGLEMEIRQIVGPAIELPRREEGKRNK